MIDWLRRLLRPDEPPRIPPAALGLEPMDLRVRRVRETLERANRTLVAVEAELLRRRREGGEG